MDAAEAHDSEAPPNPPAAPRIAEEERPGDDRFPIVGIGASAGGLEAVSQLLSTLPDKTGMGFVLVQHLDPKHESRLGDLLAKTTRMPVLEATHGLSVRRDQVHVIPPNTTLTIAQGVLQLTPRGETHGPHLSIDHFLKSLAEDRGRGAIGVILSGTGSDGTLGLAQVKAAGGITFAQDDQSAKHSGMPQSAVRSGCVDLVLSPEEIARELTRIGQHPYLSPAHTSQDAPAAVAEENGFKKILALLRSSVGVDFSAYRDTTINRRILRRMVVHTKESMADYAQLLAKDRAEIEALYQDILINVTSFFRDPGTFEALRQSVFPEILKANDPGAPIRIWVPGCSTGQEAYSLAIALVEFLDAKPVRAPIQIFATDLSDSVSLQKAREAVYPENIEAEVSPQRLRRFFSKEDGKYRVSKTLRELCVFAKHNVAADPPFSHVDLVSCQNLLIYLAPVLQKRVIPTFHYALNQPGFLVLGTSETVGSFTDLFGVVDYKYRIYVKKATDARPYPHFRTEHFRASLSDAAQSAAPSTASAADWQKETDRIVMAHYAPAGVLVNDNLDILQFRGRTSPYLEPAPGVPSHNLAKMAPEGFFLELRRAVTECRRQNAPVRRQGVRVRDKSRVWEVDLRVLPIKLPGSSEGGFLILFEEGQASMGHETAGGARPHARDSAMRWLRRWFSPPPASGGHGGPTPDRELIELRQELASTHEYLQSLVEQQDAANEELKSANEEALSSNEELQSTNEELVTAKEELQSVNEELTTVNDQLQNRNQELNRLNDDLVNLLGSANVPMVTLGIDLRIRRFTPLAGKVLNLLATDVGRPIGDIKPPVEVPDLDALITEVIDTVQVREREVRDRNGCWYALRIHPYRTADNRIDGAVVVLADIDAAKSAQEGLCQARDHLRAVIETVRDPLIVLDAGLHVRSANRSFYETFHVTPQETENQFLYELGKGQWNIPSLRTLLEDILPQKTSFDNYEVEYTIPTIGPRTLLLNARRLHREDKHTEFIVLAIEDITDRKQAQDALQEADHRKDEFLAMLAHELRNPLAPVRQAAHVLRLAGPPDEHLQWAVDVIERQVQQMSRLVDDLLDVSRISRGKISLHLEPVDLAAVVAQAAEISRPLIDARKHHLEVALPREALRVEGDATRLAQLVSNLLNNAAKYTEEGGRIRLTAEADGAQAVLRVRDTGVGIAPDQLPRIFELFTQVQGSMSRSEGGLGIGLTLVRRLVEMHGGSITALSEGLGQGSEFVVRLPLLREAPPPDTAAGRKPEGTRKVSPRRILLVDDNKDSAESLALVLRLTGHEVRTAYDGPSALDTTRANPPDVVLLDIGLPGMSGLEVARRLRQDLGLTDVLLVALTGYGQEEDRRRSQEAGCNAHLVKPVELDALQTLLARPEAAGASSTRADKG